MLYGWDNDYFDNPFEKFPLKKLLHKTEKKYRKFSHYFRKIQIKFDEEIYPDIEWENPFYSQTNQFGNNNINNLGVNNINNTVG